MIFLESVDSTHTYIKRYISENGYKEPLAIITQNQTNGIGSRDNKWEGKNGNLFFSFVIHQEELPIDLPLQSSSIYFSFFIKEILSDLGSKVFLKWPNDFYLNEKKIGGTITNFSNNLLYCGIGLNLKQFNSSYGGLDIEINLNNFLENYFNLIKKKMKWKKIFSKYRIEFESNRQYTTTINNKKVSLKDALLNEDGSINISNKKVFSLR